MLHLDRPGCQVAIYPGYTDFYDPETRLGNWAYERNRTRKGQLDFNSFLFRHALNELEDEAEEKQQGTKGIIISFTARARKNLLKKLNSLTEFSNIFITLTYPSFFPADSSEWKRHLDNFGRDIRRNFLKSWLYWKLEPQKRGAPHFHLIGRMNADIDIHEFRQHISSLWYRTCGTGDQKHLRAGTQVRHIKSSRRMIQSYVSKYIAKIDCTQYPGWSTPGRFWGVIGKENLPVAVPQVFDIDRTEYFVLRRLVKRWLKKQHKNCRKYAERMKNLRTFFVFIQDTIILQFLDLVHGAVPY